MKKREKIVIRTSIISIIANVILVFLKLLIGLLANSIAIISDAINNLSDAISSIITITGTKLANRAPDRKHPYGYGRIEYMTSFIVSAIVIYAGVTILIESIKKIIHPVIPDYSIITLIILAISIIIKFILGIYVKKKGYEVNSDSLVASGSDAFNDALISISVLLCTIIYLVFNISLEAYVGVILSVIIIKSGFGLIMDSVNNILGVRIDSEISSNIKKEIVKEENVKGAFDLILNNYGPDKYYGSVHIEVPDTLTVNEIDKLSRRITKNIMNKYGVLLHTIGIYSISAKDSKIEKEIRNLVFKHDGIIEMHGFYVDHETKNISFDIIIDFRIKNSQELYKNISNEVKKLYKDYHFNIILDIDISD